MKHYMGFAIRTEEKETGIFKRKKQEEIFCKARVGADNFAEAQQMLCDNMAKHKVIVGFVFPYFRRED